MDGCSTAGTAKEWEKRVFDCLLEVILWRVSLGVLN